MSDDEVEMAEDAAPANKEDEAPEFVIPAARYAAVEYPGPVKSIPKALHTLGGLDTVSQSLAHVSSQLGGDNSRVLELNLNPGNPFFHPVQGSVVDSGNVVVKVRTRRRKRPRLDKDGNALPSGMYIVEPLGVVTRTARFRAMADFQFIPSPDDPIIKMADALRDMDVEAIQSFSFPQQDEEYTGRDMFLPPPVFSRQNVPHMYDYRQIQGVVPTTSEHVTGEVHRLTNVHRVKSSVQQAVSFDAQTVPKGADKDAVKARVPTWATLEAKLLAILQERPVWTRTGLLNQLTNDEARLTTNHKVIMSLVTYTFSDGPFRECCIRFGYDPRTDPEARFYQRVHFRNPANARAKSNVRAPPNKGKDKEPDSSLSHTFDGVTVHAKVGNFQLCDITDPLAKNLIDATDGVRTECGSGAEGWYDADYWEQFRQVVRRKWFGLHNGHVVTSQDCEDLLGDPKQSAYAREAAAAGKSTKKGKDKGKGKGSASQSGASDSDTPGEQSDSDAPSGSASDGASDGATTVAGGDAKGKGSHWKKHNRRAPWEVPKSKRNRAKVPASAETIEERSERLRRAIGIGVAGPSSARSNPDRSGDDVSDEEEEEDDDDDDEQGSAQDDDGSS